MIDLFDLADPASAGGKRGMFRIPATLIRRNLDDLVVDDMGVHNAAPAAIVSACAGNDAFARACFGAGGLVNRFR